MLSRVTSGLAPVLMERLECRCLKSWNVQCGSFNFSKVGFRCRLRRLRLFSGAPLRALKTRSSGLRYFVSRCFRLAGDTTGIGFRRLRQTGFVDDNL
jgi:hypothetical protein